MNQSLSEVAENDRKLAENDSLAGCLVRLFWMILGNALLALSAVSIIKRPTSDLSFGDVFYWGLVGCLLVARYVDVRHFQGRTADGEPASTKDWQTYAIVLLPIALGAWLVAHALRWGGL